MTMQPPKIAGRFYAVEFTIPEYKGAWYVGETYRKRADALKELGQRAAKQRKNDATRYRIALYRKAKVIVQQQRPKEYAA
jgi:hypothetical protein